LCLNRIDIDVAIRRIDVVLYGMQAADVIQERMEDLLRFYAELSDLLGRWAELQVGIEERIEHLSTVKLKNERTIEAIFIELSLEEEKIYHKKAEVLVKRIEKERKVFDRTMIRLVSIEDKATSAALEIGKKLNEDYLRLKTQISDRDAQGDRFKEQLRGLKARP
jgi:hypothetical protein